MYKKGDKVRPIAKTVGMSWENCCAKAEMERLNQDFLYITRDYLNNRFGCNVMDCDGVLSEFAFSDLEPYEEYPNLIKINRDVLLELLQKDIFKEDIRFYVSKP
jgi:hypothetical protein